MFNEEKFIEKNIGELCQNFDLIRGKTVNIRRISPGIDSLKIVARRLLYIMFLTDRGKQFVKVAAITGECTSKLHHHSPASVKDTLVNLAQWWNNNIPLIDIHGNGGSCHDSETQVLTRNGWKYFEEITYDDLLASVDPESGRLIYEHPVNIIKYHYNGKMIRGFHKNLDFMVTPNHKMLIAKKLDRGGFENSFKFVEASDLLNYSNMEWDSYHPNPRYEAANGDIFKDLIIPYFGNGQSIDKNNYVSEEDYDGYVYCAEVPTYHTLITKRGNSTLLSGNCSGDPAGADRYILAKLSDYAYDCFFSEWKDSAVDMIMGADGKTLEPLYLPSKYPNILINGSLGIGLSYFIAQLKFHELLETHYDNQQDSYHII